ncbi:MAG: hypothetical protein RL019_825 [Pseudomonadota bacterium]|jgi:hypothetical protein
MLKRRAQPTSLARGSTVEASVAAQKVPRIF